MELHSSASRVAYDQAIQESLNPGSALYASPLNAVLLAIDARGLPLRSSPGQPDGGSEAIDQALGYLQLIRNGIQQNSTATCIFQTLAAPPETVFGSLDRALPGAPRYVLDGANRAIAEAARESGSALLDVAGLAETVGLAQWHSHHRVESGEDSVLPAFSAALCRSCSSPAGGVAR